MDELSRCQQAIRDARLILDPTQGELDSEQRRSRAQEILLDVALEITVLDALKDKNEAARRTVEQYTVFLESLG
jgi:hypothetical protein